MNEIKKTSEKNLMVFIRPTLEPPNCASGMLASPLIELGMLVAHSNSSFK